MNLFHKLIFIEIYLMWPLFAQTNLNPLLFFHPIVAKIFFSIYFCFIEIILQTKLDILYNISFTHHLHMIFPFFLLLEKKLWKKSHSYEFYFNKMQCECFSFFHFFYLLDIMTMPLAIEEKQT